MGPQANKYTSRRNLILFTVLVLASGWVGRWVDALAGGSSSASLEGTGALIWIAAPLGVSFLLRAFAGDGWADLGIGLGLKGSGLWYAVSVLVYPICAIFILVTGLVVGVISFSATGTIAVFGQSFGLLLITQLITNIPEEFGFRGYLAPKLYKLRLNVPVAHLLVGLIWGLWHLPYLQAITPYTTESLATLLPRFLLGTMAASVVYGEVRVLTRSVWPAVLMQTAGGAFLGALVWGDGLVTVSSGGWLFAPALEGGLMIALFVLVGGGIYRWRTSRRVTGQ